MVYDLDAGSNHPKYHHHTQTTDVKNKITHDLGGDLENIRMNQDMFPSDTLVKEVEDYVADHLISLR